MWMENKHLKLVCKEFISVNHYMNYRVQGKIVVAYKPKETKEFEKQFGKYVKQEIQKQNWIKPDKGKFIILDTIFYFPRVDMDAQNYFKSICDICTKCNVWEDDNIVMERVNGVYYDSKNPRIEMDIYESEKLGIFESKEEYKEFRNNNCDKCSKKSDGSERSCTIHKKILENRIIEEVTKDELNTWRCNKLKEKKIK